MTTPHVILVGLPGSGKTTVGRMVADSLERPFMDLDEEIERRQGKPIAQIFATTSERHFRGLERELTTELGRQSGWVLAPGGGWITVPDVVAILRPPARLVYLMISPATALARMGVEASRRPLLTGRDPLGRLEHLLSQRSSAYEQADWTVDVDLLNPQEVTSTITQIILRDLEIDGAGRP